MRVTDMSGVDLNVYRFDYDLTWAALLMNADGKIYHTYAGRDWTEADSHHDMNSLAAILRSTSKEHEIHMRRRRHPERADPLSVEMIPAMARKIARDGKPSCIHCHTVHDAMTYDLKEREAFHPDDRWRWPDPIQIGIRLDRRDQLKVIEVREDSPAHRAGVEVGDRLDRFREERVRTFGDLQRVLNDIPNRDPGTPELEWFRGEQARSAELELADGWREADPRVYAWRASKWPLSPKPGFGGPALGREEKQALGIPAEQFAFRVNYMVTWGNNAHTGRNAGKAGIRNGDVIVSIDGVSDFDSIEHVHAWFRLTRTLGETAEVELIREGRRRIVELPLIE